MVAEPRFKMFSEFFELLMQRGSKERTTEKRESENKYEEKEEIDTEDMSKEEAAALF